MPQVEVHRGGGVATLTLNHPETRNALSDAFLGEIVDRLQELDCDDDVRCVIVAGQPGFFSVGADLRELADRSSVDLLLGCRAGLWDDLRQIRVPLVAAVSGYCFGGGFELALACDLIVAARGARFGQPETGIGLVPGGGGSQILVRLAGRAVAADIVLTGRRLTALEAKRIGVVARVCGEDWLEQAEDLARRIADRPRVAQMLAKRALSAALEMPLSEGIALERTVHELSLGSADAREAISAFLEDREPALTGR